MQPLGKLVKKWREGSRLGLTEFARMVGVDYQKIQYLEKSNPSRVLFLPELARAMGSSVEDLMAGKVPPLLAPREGGAPDEPERAQIHEQRASLTRDQFLQACANLSTPDWQLTARLMVAVGILPGAVEAMKKWDLKEAGSGQPEVRPMTVEETTEEQARRKPL